MADDNTLARTMYGEARGEGAAGMQAVACVVINRAVLALAYVATHYYDGRSPMPKWAKDKMPCDLIGHHLFFNDIERETL